MKLFITILVFCNSLAAFAQTIKGVVVDGTGQSAFKTGKEAIGYATVELFDSSATITITTEITSKDGTFLFTNASAGVYCIKVSGLFYRDTTFRNIKIKGDTTLKLSLHRLPIETPKK